MSLRTWWKRLWCRHVYRITNSRRTIRYMSCVYCGKPDPLAMPRKW